MMIFNEESYRPLIDGLTIRESEIDGLGLYATMDFGKDYQFGVSHFLDGDKLIRTPLGGFINHSEEPNCRAVECVGSRVLLALRDIGAGEELTVKYALPEYHKDGEVK